MKHNTKKYGFRWRMVWTNKDGTISEIHRVRFTRTPFMLDLIWERWHYGPGGYKMLYIVYPGIVDVNDHNWENPKWIQRHNIRVAKRNLDKQYKKETM